METFDADDVAVMSMLIAVKIAEIDMVDETPAVKAIYYRCKSSVEKVGKRDGRMVYRSVIKIATQGRWF